MKRLIIASACLAALASCKNRDESTENLDVAAIKIDSVRLAADTVTVGNSLIINTYSTMSSGCESFYKYSYSADRFSRTVSASRLKSGAACGRSAAVASQFTFSPKAVGTYSLKFWSGQSAGADVWIEKAVLVR